MPDTPQLKYPIQVVGGTFAGATGETDWTSLSGVAFVVEAG
jgi:hypothetical protein